MVSLVLLSRINLILLICLWLNCCSIMLFSGIDCMFTACTWVYVILCQTLLWSKAPIHRTPLIQDDIGKKVSPANEEVSTTLFTVDLCFTTLSSTFLVPSNAGSTSCFCRRKMIVRREQRKEKTQAEPGSRAEHTSRLREEFLHFSFFP